jgi:hypothetical protein
VFLEIPNTRAISEIDKPSARRNRRISAQSSTPNTYFLPNSVRARVSGKLVNFQLPRGGQYWAAVDNDAVDQRHQTLDGPRLEITFERFGESPCLQADQIAFIGVVSQSS